MAFHIFSYAYIILLLFPYITAKIDGNISSGSTLTAENDAPKWLSPSGDFAFGFHQLENGQFLLAIWYEKIPSKTIVWYANGNNPAPKGSKLELNDRGLVLNSPQNRELWQSDPATGSISYGLMNDTGNFQLLDTNSEVLWESFDHPTDTLLPTQIMEVGETLSSTQTETNFSRGRFQFRLLPDGNAVLNPINLPTNYTYDAYYASGTYDPANQTNSGYRVIFDESGFLYIMKRSGEMFNITNPNAVLSDRYYYRATINYDGVFTILHHPKDQSTGWTVGKTIPENICTDLAGTTGGSGVCGFNSICTLQTDQRPSCGCPPGFSLLDSTDKFGSCKPNFEFGCKEGEQSLQEDKYFMKELPNTNWAYGDYETYYPFNSEDCKNYCLKDCLCMVSLFREDQCWKKRLPLMNGREDKAESGTIFIKLPKNNINTETPQTLFPNMQKYQKDQDTLITVISVLLGSSVLVAAVCIGFFFYHQKKTRVDKTVVENNLRCFTFKELAEATSNFKDELGRGSCGIVYKGSIELTLIAIKKLDKVLQDRDKEFKNEVNVIGQTHHRNLVQLIGYCDEEQHRILVYEFMSNGTLASFLFGRLMPSWNQRVNIAFGIARGLFYLHEECCTQIIHCDIKPQNILLDEYNNVRISDFGLAKLLLINQSHTKTGIRGTKGYIAPEWFRSAPITAKVDVYSFGVLLLEIICCRKNVDMEIGNEEKAILTDWAYDCFRSGSLDILVGNDDEAINDMRLERFVMVAIWCLQEDPSLRPTMKMVMLMLEGITQVTSPPCPFPFSSISCS